jgi:hypothetical protein
MEQIRRDDNILVLQENKQARLVFSFRGKHWSLYSLILSVIVLIGTLFVESLEQVAYKSYLVPGGYVFTVLFLYSSLYSYFSTKELIIDSANKLVKYRKSDLYGQNKWAKPFSECIGILICRPGKKSFLIVLLQTQDMHEIPLGINEAGISSVKKAREIANNIGNRMSLQVIEEPSVER